MSDKEQEERRESRSRSRSRSHRSESREKRSYSRSRSRSKDRRSRSRSRRSYSRSRSRSYERRGRRGFRDRSKSPMSSRRRHRGNRDDPDPNRCVGVFGLSLDTRERDVEDYFAKFGRIESCQIVVDRYSGRSRGFAFVHFEDVDDAIEAKEQAAGCELDGKTIRVDYSVTERAHTPTPGVYLGRPTDRPRGRYGGGGGGSSYGGGYGGNRYGGGYGGGRRRSPSPYRRRRSPSPYRSRRYSRSRSRSYSPRR